MSRTYRKQTHWKYPHRNPKTLNELKQVRVSNDYLDTEYKVSTRHRYIPTLWDDQVISAYLEQDHHRNVRWHELTTFMEYRYPANSPSMYLSYFRNREGPNGILVYYKNVSRFVNTSKEMRAIFGPAKFTDSVKAASAWCDEMIEKYESVEEPSEGRVDTSFASEVLEEKNRMVI